MSYFTKYYLYLVNKHNPFLLLESGREDLLLLENGGRIELDKLDEITSKQISFLLDEGNGNPNYIGFETGFFSLNSCTWVYDSTLNKNVINFPNTSAGLGDISSGTGQILFPSKYSISVDINVRNASSNFDTIFCTQSRTKVILIISQNGEILCTYDGSVNIGAFTNKSNFAQSFGTGLYSLNTWTNVKIIVDRTLGTVNCEVNGSPVGGTINPINGAMDNAYHKLQLIGSALDSSFPKAFDGKMSNIQIQDLT